MRRLRRTSTKAKVKRSCLEDRRSNSTNNGRDDSMAAGNLVGGK